MIELIASKLQRHRRFVSFCIVGASGVIVNLGAFTLALWAFEGRGARGWWVDNVAVFVGWLISVASNFTLNDRLTFQTEGDYRGTWRTRLAQYYVSAFAAFSIQWLVFNGLMWLSADASTAVATDTLWRYVWMTLLEHRRISANLVGIGVATLANYLLAKHWVFRAE